MTAAEPRPAGDALPETLTRAITGLMAGHSLEITARDIRNLAAAAPHVAPGSRVLVAWLPSDTMADRIDAAVAVRSLGLEPVPHVAARYLESTGDLERLLAGLSRAAAVREVLLVAGDMARPRGTIVDAVALARSPALADHGIVRVGITGYPEGHPRISADALVTALDAKLEALAARRIAAFIVTQLCFEAAPIAAWLATLRRAHPTVPVRVGLAGPASLATLARYAAICGLGPSAKALARNTRSLTRLVTEAGPDPVIRALADDPAVAADPALAIHLFSFGGIARTARFGAALREGRFVVVDNEPGVRITA